MATQEIRRLIASGPYPENRTFRVGAQPGGCSDLYYVLQPSPTIAPDDQVWDWDDLRIVVDPKSLAIVDGATLDYAQDLMGGGFRFHNPHAIASCGCGASFSLTSASDTHASLPPSP